MLLEVSCSLDHFEEFINKCKAADILVDFDIHAADQNSSFKSEGEKASEEVIIDEGEGDLDDDIPEDPID